MRIALLGGTGDIGAGLALRWGLDTDHELLVGSRDADRARASAEEYEAILADRGVDRSIEGDDNATVAAGADVVVAGVPAYHVSDTVEAVADGLDPGAILVSPAVGMKSDEAGMHYHRPGAGSVTAVAAAAAPDGVPVVGAFHSVSAERLSDLDADLDQHTLVVGDDEEARATVARLADEVGGLGALDAGPLANAAEVESLTPLLINLARYNEGVVHAGVRFD